MRRFIIISAALAVALLALPTAVLASRHSMSAVSTRLHHVAVLLDGTSGYVATPSAPDIEPEHANGFTSAVWLRLSSVNNNPLPRLWEKDSDYVCIMGDPSNGQYRRVGMEVQNSTGTGNANGGATEFWGTTRLRTGVWYHVVTTFDGATGEGHIYINGVEDHTRTIYPWPATPNNLLYPTSLQPLELGRAHTDLAHNLAGALDGFMFWTRALSPAEVASAYAGSPPTDVALRYDFSSASGGIVPDHSQSASHPGTIYGGATLIPALH
jgi:hypothetical protein